MTTATQPTTPGEDVARFLSDRQIDYDLKEIDISDIDVETSKHNQARFLPLHDETVLVYGAAMEQGDSFPPVIVSGNKGKYLVLDGNHRVAAANLAGFKATKAFVCKNISKAQAELVTFEANARHGLPTSLDERIQQALYLVNIGNQPKAVAQALSVPVQKLYKAISASKGAARLSKVGIDPKRFSSSSMSRFASIASNTVLAPVAEIAVAANLNHDEINEIITAVNAEDGGEASQIRIVETFRKRYAPRMRSTSGGRMVLPENVTRVHRIAKMVSNLDGKLLATQMSKMDPTDADEVRRQVYESIAKLVAVSESFKNGDR